MMRGTSIAMHANNVLQTPCNLLFPQTHCQVRVLSPGSWLHIQHSYMNTHEHYVARTLYSQPRLPGLARAQLFTVNT